MAGVVATNLSVSFGEAEDQSGRILLKQASKRADFNGALWGHCYCNETVRYLATVGTVQVGNRYARTINSESLSFSNSARVALAYPGAQGVTIQQSVFFRQVTRNNVIAIEQVSVPLIYNAETEEVVTQDGLPVYGRASVSYTTLYELFYYYPYTQDFGLRGGGVTFSLGTVFAYTDRVVETITMDWDLSSPKEWVEYARVVSKIVLDPKGTWEFPTNWASTYNSNREKIGDERADYPADGTFPVTDATVDASNNFVDERVHMIIEVNSIASLQYKDFNNGGSGYWAWENPYFGDSSYNPVYEIRFAEPPGGSRAQNAEEFQRDLYNRTWRDVFLDVNKTKLLEKLQNEYPGASEYSRPRQ